MVIDKDGNKVLNGASIILGTGEDDSYIKFDARRIDFSAEDFKINANKIDFVSDRFTMDADKIDFVGEVTFLKPNDLGENGTTVIDGGRIKTGTLSADTISGGTIDAKDVTIENLDASKITSGTIKADFIDVTDLKVDAMNITGTLTFKQLPNTVATTDELMTYSEVTTITNDTISTTSVTAQNLTVMAANIDGTLTADQINGDNLKVKDGIIEDCVFQQRCIISGTGSIFGQAGSNITLTPNVNLYANGGHSLTGGGTLGGTWTLSSGEAVTSDINFKNTILPLSAKHSVLFDALIPVEYKYNDGTSNRVHTGFIAQDVEKAILSAGLTTQDFAGFIRAIETDEEGNEYEKCYLRYDEFIALNTHEIQKLKAEIAELKAIIAGGEAQ
jgi:hypothetical protein